MNSAQAVLGDVLFTHWRRVHRYCHATWREALQRWDLIADASSLAWNPRPVWRVQRWSWCGFFGLESFQLDAETLCEQGQTHMDGPAFQFVRIESRFLGDDGQ